MLIFGHTYINFTPFYHISEISDIERTPPNSTLFLEFNKVNLDIIQHLQHNNLRFALEVSDIESLVFAHNLHASYMVVSENLAKSAQTVAENYLFDAKILCRVHQDQALEEIILEGIDGVIYPSAIIKASL